MADKSKKTICLFNCDNTYKLDVVEAFLMEMNEKHGFNFAIGKYNLGLQQMADYCKTKIPQIQMDCAIFVLHAHESRLSINEDSAGIGYAKIYRALLEATENKVLIVIGGDDEYKEEDDEEQVVISRWARRKVESQFDAEYLDGRKSFIFSWNKTHRKIHEEALFHYFDPRKNGKKFQYQPKLRQKQDYGEAPLGDRKETPQPRGNAKQEKPSVEPKFVGEKPQNKGNQAGERTGERETSELRRSQNQPNYGAAAMRCNPHYPEGIVLLETRLFQGQISYKKWHIRERQDAWKPSDTQVLNVRADKPTGSFSVQFRSKGNNGVSYAFIPTPWWRKCFDCFRMCLFCGCCDEN